MLTFTRIVMPCIEERIGQHNRMQLCTMKCNFARGKPSPSASMQFVLPVQLAVLGGVSNCISFVLLN